MSERPYHCACEDFAKGEYHMWSTSATDGKASQPQSVTGPDVSARCSHEAHYLSACHLCGIPFVKAIFASQIKHL